VRQLIVHDFLCPKTAWVFYLAMNRDEKFTRSTAPATGDLSIFADRRAIFPREPEGGTWIAAQ